MNSKHIGLTVLVINVMVCHGHDCNCVTNDYGTVHVPKAVVVIFTIVLLILTSVVAFLVYVITRSLKSFRFYRKEKSSAESIEMGTMDRDDTELITHMKLNSSNSYEVKECPSKQTRSNNKKNNTSSPLQTQDKDDQISTEADISMVVTPQVHPYHTSRIIKGIGKDMPLILPEQMSQICREVLTKTHKSDDIGGSLHNIDLIAKEDELVVESEKKCGSTSVLDIYDVLPSTLKRKKSNAAAEKTNSNAMDECDSPKDGNNLINVKTRFSSTSEKGHNSNKEKVDSPRDTNKLNDAKTCPSLADEERSIEKQDKIDSLKDTNKLNYVEPYFSPVNENRSIQKQDKVDYAILNKINATEEKVDLNDHYEFPKPCDDNNKMYINANNNLFKSN